MRSSVSRMVYIMYLLNGSTSVAWAITGTKYQVYRFVVGRMVNLVTVPICVPRISLSSVICVVFRSASALSARNQYRY